MESLARDPRADFEGNPRVILMVSFLSNKLGCVLCELPHTNFKGNNRSIMIVFENVHTFQERSGFDLEGKSSRYIDSFASCYGVPRGGPRSKGNAVEGGALLVPGAPKYLSNYI